MSSNMTAQSNDSSEAPKRRVLIVDDHPVFRYGIAALINAETDLAVCGEASSSPSALEAMRTLQPDVALLDISLPGTNGIELIKLMKSPEAKPVIKAKGNDPV